MRLTIKLGSLFLVILLLLEFVIFVLLYQALLNSRINEETQDLIARGNNHRDVLEKQFDVLTLHHVALMEQQATTKVVITDTQKNILESSSEIDSRMKAILNKKLNATHHGILIESDWRDKAYFASVSPIVINGKHRAYVFMFLDTRFIQDMNRHLKEEIINVSLISLIISVITVIFLSRTITKPLIRMKETTQKLSRGYHKVSLDINRNDELGELALEITSLSEELYRLQKERKEFLANVSHELRTPLTYIKGYTNVAKRPLLSKKEREKYLRIIDEEAENLTKLIEDLFELAKMDQTQFLINKKEVSITKLIRKVIDNMKPAFYSKKVTLDFVTDGDYTLHIDDKRIAQVILILLDNALKHSAAGTGVIVKVGGTKDHIIIQVIDQGEGIPEEDLAFIWERLYRVEKSRTREKGGSGLGLAIAKEIVERHDGKITVTSQIGHGTTMTILLSKEVRR
ncbi:sensor histidine kinase [Fictibacillus sp. S7]|uniref:sensor histidine kinase n=1 Tax=Fictibacillus sp. S7 TaxID=2212476 RepID=UPI00101093ED|nr:HAMP domain-containing sensor histidine kinase [Fictibacillus sp. S7]RXZ02159.1 two-component sensor histidine kinase [Fictibacillus sp. S7]